jgi:hypothetical protein
MALCVESKIVVQQQALQVARVVRQWVEGM